MALTIVEHSRPGSIFTEVRFVDETTGVDFSTDDGSLHAYKKDWLIHKGHLSVLDLQQIREALGRFIEALIPEEVK